MFVSIHDAAGNIVVHQNLPTRPKSFLKLIKPYLADVVGAAKCSEAVLAVMRRHPEGRAAAIIGEVTGGSSGKVFLRTAIGGRRAIEMLAGEQLPRIC
jgi:hypothetical protein